MKYFTEFLGQTTRGKLVEQCGSDSIYILDGRNNLAIMIQDSKDRMIKLVNVQPSYSAFHIHRGDLKNSQIIHTHTEEIKL